MKINDIVRNVGNKFSYKSDPKWLIDPWYVMPLKDGKYSGDCDDFALTTVYQYLGFIQFVWQVLILGKFKFVRCKTYTGEYHVFVEHDGKCWDNWSLEVMEKSRFLRYTKHEVLKSYNTYQIVVKCLAGFFLRNKRK